VPQKAPPFFRAHKNAGNLVPPLGEGRESDAPASRETKFFGCGSHLDARAPRRRSPAMMPRGRFPASSPVYIIPSSPPLTLVVQKYKPPIFDAWEEAAVKVVEKDPQLAEYEARDEAALAVTVEAFAAYERQRGACSGALGHKSWLFCRFSCTSLVVFWHRCKRKSRTLRNQEQNTSSSAGAYATFAFDFFSAHTSILECTFPKEDGGSRSTRRTSTTGRRHWWSDR
jgi:hypothetical protein